MTINKTNSAHITAGNHLSFAIECQIRIPIDPDWVFGHIQFWADGQAIGNWEDSVTLAACVRWLKDFAIRDVNRCEPELMSLPRQDAFKQMYDPIFTKSDFNNVNRDFYGRLWLGDLGMSAFENVDIFLLEDKTQQRLIWRDVSVSEEILETFFSCQTMQTIAGQFCKLFDEKINNLAGV